MLSLQADRCACEMLACVQVQSALLAEAEAFRDANIQDVASYEELKQAIGAGKWARGPWAGGPPPMATGLALTATAGVATYPHPSCMQSFGAAALTAVLLQAAMHRRHR